jgi:hypothetical protein
MPACIRDRVARSSAIALITLLVAAGTASAQDATPAAAAPPADRPLFDGTHFGVGSSFGTDSPVALLAGNTGAVLWGVGALFSHDGNAEMNKTAANLVLNLQYMIHNRFPFAMGPEIDFIPELAPSSFDNNTLQVGWSLWYAPWNAPIVIGSAVLVNVDFPAGKSAVVTSLTPAVRIVFGFH